MPELSIRIGGRSYVVACQAGEEKFLEAAARILDAEATTLTSQIGKLPENRVLLMAGLMLADKAAAAEDAKPSPDADVGVLQARITSLEAALEQANGYDPAAKANASVSADVTEKMAKLASKAEIIADQLDRKLAETDNADGT